VETFKVTLFKVVNANIGDGRAVGRIAGLPADAPPGVVGRCPEGTSLTVRCEHDTRGRPAMTGTGLDEVFIGTDGKERIEPRGGSDVVRARGATT